MKRDGDIAIGQSEPSALTLAAAALVGAVLVFAVFGYSAAVADAHDANRRPAVTATEPDVDNPDQTARTGDESGIYPVVDGSARR